MNEQEWRQVIAHSAIGVAVCVGGYMALVDGPRKRLADARAEGQTLTQQVRTAEQVREQLPAMQAALDKASRDAAEIKDMGRLAREERALFAAVMTLAGTHHVRLDELNPNKPGAGTAAAPQPGPAARNDAAVGYTMVAVAAYDNLAAFVAALRSELGYSVIRSIRLSPVQDERVKLVRATIETEHYSFDTSPPKPAVADAGAH